MASFTEPLPRHMPAATAPTADGSLIGVPCWSQERKQRRHGRAPPSTPARRWRRGNGTNTSCSPGQRQYRALQGPFPHSVPLAAHRRARPRRADAPRWTPLPIADAAWASPPGPGRPFPIARGAGVKPGMTRPPAPRPCGGQPMNHIRQGARRGAGTATRPGRPQDEAPVARAALRSRQAPITRGGPQPRPAHRRPPSEPVGRSAAAACHQQAAGRQLLGQTVELRLLPVSVTPGKRSGILRRTPWTSAQ